MSNTTESSTLLRICAALIWGIASFLFGGLLASWLTPKDVGLAGGAYVLFYGVIAAFAGIFLLFFLSRRANDRWLKVSIAYALGMILLLSAGLYMQSQKRERERQQQGAQFRLDVAKSRLATHFSEVRPAPDRGQQPYERVIGLGFADMPISNLITRLDFYADPLAWTPTDSFVLEGEKVHYAPPYILPYYQKLDYNQLTFRWLAVAHDRVQIELNAQQGRKAWVAKNQLRLSYWPEFLVQLFAVEAIDPDNNPLRIKPQDNAALVALPEGIEFLRPMQVTEEWIFLEFWHEAQGEFLGEGGWLRWREGDDLLVKWDYRL